MEKRTVVLGASAASTRSSNVSSRRVSAHENHRLATLAKCTPRFVAGAASTVLCALSLTGCCQKIAEQVLPQPASSATAPPGSAPVMPTAPGSQWAGAGQLLPLAAGQWVKYKVYDSHGGAGELTYKILAQRGTSYDMEVVTQKTSRSIIFLTLAIGKREDPNSYRVEAAKVKTGTTPVIDLKPGLVNPMLAGVLSQIVVPPLGNQPREDVVVPAGTFAQSLKIEQTYTIFGKPFSGTSWVHPTIPLMAAAKTQSNQEGGTRTELIAFGLTGAKSELLGSTIATQSQARTPGRHAVGNAVRVSRADVRR
ncbi:MAG: hypothetical protein U0165_06715 [Polyangiaceae bacterium]